MSPIDRLRSPRSPTPLILHLQGAKQFLGLPSLPQPQDRTLTFFRPLGARNATIGLSALILSLRGDRIGMATSFALSAIPGVVDAVTCAQNGGEYRLHVIATGICLGLSWMLVKAGS